MEVKQHKNADDMILQLNTMKLSLDKYRFNLDQNRKQISILESELQRHSYVTEYAAEARDAAAEALAESSRAEQQAGRMITRIQQQLRTRANDLNSFSAAELGAIPRRISETAVTMQNVEKQATYLERRTVDLNKIRSKVQLNLSRLRSQIDMAKHVASSIKISITGDETKGGACLRSYDAEMSPNTHNEISLIYGIETADRDSPLVYIPSSKKSVNEAGEEVFDFLALEMVDRRIRFVWNTGAGSRAITHNLAIDTAFNLARQDDMWYRVTAERIGNIGRLNVRKVSTTFLSFCFARRMKIILKCKMTHYSQHYCSGAASIRAAGVQQVGGGREPGQSKHLGRGAAGPRLGRRRAQLLPRQGHPRRGPVQGRALPARCGQDQHRPVELRDDLRLPRDPLRRDGRGAGAQLPHLLRGGVRHAGPDPPLRPAILRRLHGVPHV